MVKTSNCPPLVAMSVVTRCRRTFSSRVTHFRVTPGFLAVKSPVRRCILIMSLLLTVATVRVVWAIAWLARIREIPAIAARSGILIVSLPVEWLNALRPGHMLGAVSAIVNSDSRPVGRRFAPRPLQLAQRRSRARARAIARPRWLTAFLAVGLTSPKLAPHGG